MKKILLLSDTHNYLDESIKTHAFNADEIWHAGDIGSLHLADQLNAIRPLRAVYGNIDDHTVRTAWPMNQQFNCDGINVYMTHIAGYPGRYNPEVIQTIKSTKPDLFICGHSHILRVMRDVKYNLLYMNPGAAGKHGFHHIRTMLRFSISSGKIENVEVIELGLRGALS